MKHIITAVLAIAVLILMPTNVYGKIQEVKNISNSDFSITKDVYFMLKDGEGSYLKDGVKVIITNEVFGYNNIVTVKLYHNGEYETVKTMSDVFIFSIKESDKKDCDYVICDNIFSHCYLSCNISGYSLDLNSEESDVASLYLEYIQVKKEADEEKKVTVQDKHSQDDIIAELKNKITSLESRVVELESKPENLSPQDRRKALQAEYDQCQKDIDAKKQEIKRLSDEVKELNARKNKLDNMIRSPNI